MAPLPCRLSQKTLYIASIASAIFLTVFYIASASERREFAAELAQEENFSNDTLFDLRLEYVIDSDACQGDVNTIIIVTSYFGNVETRSAMRRAFPPKKLQDFKIKRVFLLGLAPRDKYTSQNAVVDESARFGDVLQGNFVESYRNLTYKHVMGHKWVSERCGGAKYVIKMDDDIAVNLYKMREVLVDLKWEGGQAMAGYVLKNMKPIREPRNKWFVKEEEFGESAYPVFLSGWFYVTTPKISRKVFSLSHVIPYFWIDDVYVTGLIAEKLKIARVNLNDLFTVHPEFLRCCMSDVIKSGVDCELVVGPNGGDNNLYYEFNKVMRRCFYDVCKKRVKSLNETCVAERIIGLGRGDPHVDNYKLF